MVRTRTGIGLELSRLWNYFVGVKGEVLGVAVGDEDFDAMRVRRTIVDGSQTGTDRRCLVETGDDDGEI